MSGSFRCLTVRYTAATIAPYPFPFHGRHVPHIQEGNLNILLTVGLDKIHE
jgi:hypothetical protein